MSTWLTISKEWSLAIYTPFLWGQVSTFDITGLPHLHNLFKDKNFSLIAQFNKSGKTAMSNVET
jgi:hypothetical protein